jgi:hypothetical protein
MAKPALDRSCVVALIGEGIAAGVPQHVGVRLDLQAGGDRGALDHTGEPGRRELLVVIDRDDGDQIYDPIIGIVCASYS